MIFTKNLESLQDPVLKEKLVKLKSTNSKTKFKVLASNDPLDLNLLNTQNKTKLYQNPLEELQEKLELYNKKYLLYPVLYFYGLGNGVLLSVLLKNKYLEKLIVFEKDEEIIYEIFHLIDLSNSKLLIIHNITPLVLHTLALEFIRYSRIYFLDLASSYYEDQKEALELNQQLVSNFKNEVLLFGNDCVDNLIGFSQMIYNLPELIKSIPYKQIIKQNKNKYKTAIVVSTGPSLTKQLKLLKENEHRALIIAADSAYSILAKEKIACDYVFSLERISATSLFFDYDFKKLNKNTIFITTHLTNPKTIQNLKKYKLKFNLAYRNSSFIQDYLHLREYGELAEGHSVAHLCYFFACELEVENIILIGQDLAYSKTGASHPKEHSYGSFDNLDKKDITYHTKTKGYYGGEIYTKELWNVFRQTLEKAILYAKNILHINTFNATQGGAYINHATNLSFKKSLNLLDKKVKKTKNLKPYNKDKTKQLLLKSLYKIAKSFQNCSKLTNKANTIKQEINLSLLPNLTYEEQKYLFSYYIKLLDDFKLELEKAVDIYETISVILNQFELNLVKIYTLNPLSSEDVFNKNILWIKEHLELLNYIIDHLHAQKHAILSNIKPLIKTLKAYKLHKYLPKALSCLSS